MAKAQTQERPATQQPPRQAPAGNLPATQEQKRVHPLVEFRNYADQRLDTLQASLPKHISPDVFMSIVMTALQKKPELLTCTKQSLWNACVMAAQDGLLPDGREGAIAPYGQNKDGKRVAEIATWMPMIEGLRKKARNSGEILNWEVHAVRARDHFRFALGDDAFIEHEPYFGSDDPGDVLGVYSIATLKDGIKSRDVMSIRDIKKIEAKSSAKNGPWKDPTFFGEMAKKTVARRHYKQLPHSAGLDRLMARDDAEFDLDHQADEQIEQRSQRRLMSTTAAFDRFADSAPMIEHDPETGEVVDDDFGGDDPRDDLKTVTNADQQSQGSDQEAEAKAAREAEAKAVAERAAAAEATRKAKEAEAAAVKEREAAAEKTRLAEAARKAAAAKKDDPITSGPIGNEAASQVSDDLTDGLAGAADKNDPGVDQDRRWPNGATPSNADEYEHYAETKIGDFTKPNEVAPWWKSADEIALRKTCQVPQAMFDAILKKAQNRVAELSKK